jgi:ribokinase
MDIFCQAEIIVLQMEIHFETTAYIFQQAKKYDKKVMFNLAPARPFDLSVLRQVYAFVVNEVEAAMVTGLKVESDAEIIAAAGMLIEMGPKIAVITLGSRGSYIASAEYRQFVPAFIVKAVDTTAAGDIYSGSLSVAMVEGKSLVEAVRFAGAASAISVTRMGAQPSAPNRKEIDDLLSGFADF